MEIITNNVPRDLIDAWQLTEKEREEFDYLDWSKIEKGEDSATFVRYKGELYDVSDMMSVYSLSDFHEFRGKWDAYVSDTYFSGILLRYVPDTDFEQVVMGRYYG